MVIDEVEEDKALSFQEDSKGSSQSVFHLDAHSLLGVSFSMGDSNLISTLIIQIYTTMEIFFLFLFSW